MFCWTSDGAISAIPVSREDGLTFGAVRALFPRRGIRDLDVAPEGGFVAIVPENPAAQSLIVVVNWAEQLKR